MSKERAGVSVQPFGARASSVLRWCEEARSEEERGNFEGARAALNGLWERIGERPDLEGCTREEAAEVLLCVGTLTGKIGSAKQIRGAQELAKDLICESANIFAELHQSARVGEARTNLAYCYLREGRFDEARLYISDALDKLPEGEAELRFRALILRGYVERDAKRLQDSLIAHRQAATLVERVGSRSLKGKFQNEYAAVLMALGLAEQKEEYLDEALIQFTAATVSFEDGENLRDLAAVLNNIGFLCVEIGRLDEAHRHLDRARKLFSRLSDEARVLQVDETRARAFLKQGRNFDALKVIKAVVGKLERGEEAAILAEALTTYGVALARSGNHGSARNAFARAVAVALDSGAGDCAGLAWLALIEEVLSLSAEEARAAYGEAARLLSNAQDASTLKRLARAGGQIINTLAGVRSDGEQAVPRQPTFNEEFWRSFSLPDAKKDFEREWVERALKAADGNGMKAAEYLKIHHQRMYQLSKAYGLKSMQLRKTRQGEAANVTQMFDTVEIELPDELAETRLKIHRITTNALRHKGIYPGDRVVVQIGRVEEGDYVGVRVSRAVYMVGLMRLDGDEIVIENHEACERFAEGGVNIEGKLVGFCKEADIAKGRPARLRMIR